MEFSTVNRSRPYATRAGSNWLYPMPLLANTYFRYIIPCIVCVFRVPQNMVSNIIILACQLIVPVHRFFVWTIFCHREIIRLFMRVVGFRNGVRIRTSVLLHITLMFMGVFFRTRNIHKPFRLFIYVRLLISVRISLDLSECLWPPF